MIETRTVENPLIVHVAKDGTVSEFRSPWPIRFIAITFHMGDARHDERPAREEHRDTYFVDTFIEYRYGTKKET